MRKTHCPYCGLEGNNVDTFCVITPNNKKVYYCSKEHYDLMSRNDLMRLEMKYFLIDILKINYTKALATYVNKNILEYESRDLLESLHYVTQQRFDIICRYLQTIDFNNNTAKVKYFFKMVEESVVNDKHERDEIKKQQERVVVVNEVVEMTKTTVKNRKSVSDWL